MEFFLDTRCKDLLDQIIESCGANGDEDSSGGGRGIHPRHSALVHIAIAEEEASPSRLAGRDSRAPD